MNEDSVGVKKTKIGLIPLDWEFSNIGKYCNVITGGTPSTKIEKYFNPSEIPWMRSGEIKGFKIKSISAFISKEGLENSAAKILPKKSVVIALAGQGKTRGTTAPLEVVSSCNQSVACMVPNGKLDYLFLHYHLSRLYKYIRNITGDVGREGLNLRLIRKFPLILPPLSEQQKIASILSNMDDLILQTEEYIKILQVLKKGAMQRLFTEGIGHTEFKEMRLGKIPKEWEILKIGDILNEEIRNGVYKPAENYRNGEYRIIQLTDLYNSEIYIEANKLDKVNILKSEFLKYEIKKKDILINRVSKVEEGVGKALLIDLIKDLKVVYESNMFRIRLNNEIIDNLFFIYFTRTSIYTKQARVKATTTNQTSINQPNLRSIKIYLPKLEEQKEIAAILSNLDNRIIGERKLVLFFKKIKKGLMQDLLTGKKRVKIN